MFIAQTVIIVISRATFPFHLESCNNNHLLLLNCRPGAGRQLLVDLHHLSQWLTSEKLGLLSTTLQSLASLPIMAEMEQGLLLVCGATADDSQGSPLHSDGHSRPTASLFSSHVQGLSSLPVWTEIAWHSTTDWFKCMV